MKFTAVKRVMNNSPVPRVICEKGDTVVVKKQYCLNGPTVIEVNGEESCVPFPWVVEMGLPCTSCHKRQPMHTVFRMGFEDRLCCRCHVKDGGVPAKWHRDCMLAAKEMEAHGQKEKA